MVQYLTAPDSPENLREFLDDPSKTAAAFETSESAHKFIESYRIAANQKDPDLKSQLVAQHDEVLKFALEEAVASLDGEMSRRVPMAPEAQGRGAKAIYSHLNTDRKSLTQIAASGHGPGVGLANSFDDIGDFFTAAFRQIKQKGFNDARLKDLSEGIPGDGGILVLEEYWAELFMTALETAVVRPRARVVPMGSPSLRFPSIRDTSHASNVFGGVSGTWVAEGGTVSSTTNQPTFSGIRLVAHKLTGYSVVSNELRADSSISIDAVVNGLYPAAIAYFEDDAFINGTGVGQPLGLINADAMVSVAKETGQAATTIVWENILNMYSRMHPASIGAAVWLVHTDTFPQLAAMSLGVGTGGSAVWLSNGVGGPPMTILGRPVVITEKAQTLGTAGDITFVDFSQYLIGDRQALTIQDSDQPNFTTDEHVYRFVSRVDGRPWVVSALTPRNGSNTVSPFVNLATRS